MAKLDLKLDERLLEACNRAESNIDPAEIDKVAHFLELVHSIAPGDRSEESFVRLVWEQNPLQGLGRGNYALEDAYKDAGFVMTSRRRSTRLFRKGDNSGWQRSIVWCLNPSVSPKSSRRPEENLHPKRFVH